MPVSGFYEWQKQGKAKQPYWIGMVDKEPFAFAGLWERWRSGTETIDTFSIITGEPNELVAPIHDRMPVILPPESYEAWMGGTALEAVSMLVPYPADQMAAYRIGTAVNSVKNEGPELVAPVP